MERLQKTLARAGVASRRAAERLMLEGRVRVNGKACTTLGTRVDPGRDAIKVDGKRVPPPPAVPTYLLVYKPRGYVTTLSDPQGRPTLGDLLPPSGPRVYPVGRLDFHSEGLLVVTDDGELARDLTHPRRHVPKTYRVKIQGRPTASALERLRSGIVLDGRRTRRARVRIVRSGDNPWLEITLVEGRNRQIRRMCEAVGHRVTRLRRVAVAGLQLGDQRPGKTRALSSDEVRRLKKAVSGGGPTGKVDPA